MSRIHEAIRKAAQEHRAPNSTAMTSTEEILSTSFMVAARGTRHPDEAKPHAEESELICPWSACPETAWQPNKDVMLFLSDTPDHRAREQFRLIRTKLNRIREQRPLCAITIASALSGEGKTFVAANLAHALTLQREQRVLLIDADLRQGSLARVLGARPGPGLTEYLDGHEYVENILQRGANGTVYLIPAGRRVHDAGELISGFRFRDLLLQLRPRFNWIVIDTPPTAQFADAGVIAGLCDGVLLVFGSGRTPVQLAKRVAGEFKKQGILGAVLNQVDGAATEGKYFRYYGDYGG